MYDLGQHAALAKLGLLHTVKLGWSQRFNDWADAATKMDNAMRSTNKIPWAHAAGGALIGGGAGYLSSDENALRNSALGALGGGALAAGGKHLLNKGRLDEWEKVKETLVGHPTEEMWDQATKRTHQLADKLRGPF